MPHWLIAVIVVVALLVLVAVIRRGKGGPISLGLDGKGPKS
jgi:hypothetical protein